VEQYALVPKIRNNSKLDRTEVIEKVAALVGPKHKVDLKNPEVCVLVQVVNTIVGVSVIRDYYELKQFSLDALAE
jgi:tRNA acetyltransferase TAN1